MVLNTTHYILIGVITAVFLLFLSLMSWLAVILYRRKQKKKAANEYQFPVPDDVTAFDAATPGSSRPRTLTNSDFRSPGHVYENPDVEDDDSGHGTSEDYENIHIDVIETNVEGAYARPEKSTLKKNATGAAFTNTIDKNVKFSETLQTVIDDRVPSDTIQQSTDHKT